MTMERNNNNNNIIFFGTTDFAVASLEKLNTNFNVKAVVTSHDKPAGRGLKIRESKVKKYAKQHGLQILQPSNLKDPLFLEVLNSFKCQLFVVVAFRMLPKSVWNMPKFGTVNLHASILPNYRGAAPINWVIINAEKETGVTTFFLNENIDTGDIIDLKKTTICPKETAGELHERLKIIGSELLVKTTKSIFDKKYKLIPQQDSYSKKTAPKLTKENCKINWFNNSERIFNKIRGLNPNPGATCTLINFKTELKVIIYTCKIEICKNNFNPGRIILEKKKIKISTNNGFIIPLEIKIQGKRKMYIQDLLNGFKFDENAIFI